MWIAPIKSRAGINKNICQKDFDRISLSQSRGASASGSGKSPEELIPASKFLNIQNPPAPHFCSQPYSSEEMIDTIFSAALGWESLTSRGSTLACFCSIADSRPKARRLRLPPGIFHR